MRQLETSTLSNQNISSALLAHTYTADAARAILIRVVLDQVAGGGDYEAYITLQEGGAGSAYKTHVASLTAASGVTAIMFPSIIVPVNDDDVVKVYVKGLAGDTTTPDITTRIFELSYLRPTTADYTLDVAATGEVSVDSQAIRDAMKLAPSAGAAAADSVDAKLDDILDDTGTSGVLIADDAVTAIDDVLTAVHGAGSWQSSTGAGSISQTIIVNDEYENPIDGVLVTVYAGSNRTGLVASGYTDALGRVTFEMDPGTYYVWKQRSGYNFANPDTLTVS